MNPPSSGGGDSGGGGDGAATRPSSINQMAFCHECGIEIRPLMTPDPTCPRCNGQFVEIIEEGSSHVHDEEDEDDDGVEANYPFGPLPSSTSPGFTFRTGPAAGGSLPDFLGQMLSAVAAPPHPVPRPRRDPSWDNTPEGRRLDANAERSQGSTSTNRSGATSFGPFGMQWHVQYGSGGGDPYQRAAQHQAEHDQRQQQQQQSYGSPPTLSNFLRFAFGGADSTDNNNNNNNNARHDDTYFHDDVMGGAGGVADGRHFNHDNRGTYHQPPQSPNNDTAGRNAAHNDLPPELSALRNLFTGLFGDSAMQGGSLLDILAAGAQSGAAGGPRGQWGDYVIGQQGLDDIISQLLEQTQGSNAPPPASEDVIEKLERFTRKDKERIEKARNQDCPTCKDDFLPSSPSESKEDASEATKGEAQDDDQQDELIAMPCQHVFHVDCLVPWLRLNGTCPVCRISIAKPREQDSSSSNNAPSSNNTGAAAQDSSNSTTASQTVPGGWPSPPNPFTSLFGNTFSNRHPNEGVHIPRDSPGASTTTYHPSPSASTTVTSTVYPAATAMTGGTPGISGGEVVNSIISSPPIVSDREEFFAEPQQQQQQEEEHSGSREDMRETLRRAAEARAANSRSTGGGGVGTGTSHPSLEPDELD